MSITKEIQDWLENGPVELERAERLAKERLKGLQGQERQIKELKRELEREKDFNDALVEANRTGRQSLIKFKQRVTLSQEQVMELQGQVGELQTENATLKDTIDCQDRQLKEAKEAAARADKTAEGRHRACEALELVVDQQRKKLRKIEQTIQTQGNTIAKQDDMIERMRAKIQDLESLNDEQRQLIQTLREQSAVALLQKLRDDVEEARAVYDRTEWTREHLLKAFDTYERRLGE